MAKQSGLGDNAYVGGVDVSGVVTALSKIGGGIAVLDVTTINQSAHARIAGLRDGEISFTSLFDDNGAANRAAGAGSPFVALSALPTADVHVAYCRGTAIGSPAACMVAKQLNYDGARGNDGMLNFGAQTLGNGYGLEWGQLLTAGKRTDTGATNGSSLDAGAASSFGLQAYLQVFSFSGVNVTVKLQESSDNGGGDPFADVTGGGFTVITTAPVTERIATSGAQAVKRYLRVVTATAGGFTSLVFAVIVVRNSTTPVF